MLLLQVLLTWTLMWRPLSCQATSGDILTAAGQETRGQLTRGDPCEPTNDQNLVCCAGNSQSTLIYRDEECCNGRPVGRGELCCEWTLPVPRGAPTHDSCCLDVQTSRGLTFDSNVSFCDRERWEIRERPFRDSMPPRSFLSKLRLSGRRFPSPSLGFRTGLCGSGSDENRSSGPRFGAEEARCCGRVSYYASQKICCDSNLYDMPSTDAQCCSGHAYAVSDVSNPCLITCNGLNFNRETQLCCQGVIHPVTSDLDICCGTNMISTHSYGCCADQMPFHRRFMQCDWQGKLKRKRENVFTTNKLCRGRLPAWSDGWPEPALTDNLLHIRGQVENVTVDIAGEQPRVHLVIHPLRVLSSLDVAHEAGLQTDRLDVQALLEPAHPCQAEQILRNYLRGKTFRLFFTLASVHVSSSGATVVRVPSSSSEHLMMVSGSE